ncbi:MAG: peptide ABC transporter substrate-binding protein [Verrucomicrobia bacterium]|nr:peptide ABC transporter substrate-binding protein [Verrucomicrobiota bacterium]
MKSLRLLLAVALPLIACKPKQISAPDDSQPGRTGKVEQIFHKGNGAEPQDLDPAIVTGVTEHHVIMSLLEGLVIEDPKDLHPIPGVAEKWDISADGTVYTFHLRKNAKWSNGAPVTAKDFLESYKRILTPSLASQYAYMHFVVKNAEAYATGKLKDFSQVGYKAADDFTFQITLEAPTPYLLSLMCHTSWFPVHVPTVAKFGDPYQRLNTAPVEVKPGKPRSWYKPWTWFQSDGEKKSGVQGNTWTRPGNYVGNGPFTLSEWKENEVIIVKRSATYWDAKNVKLDAIHFHAITSQETEEREFRAGNLHVTDTLPPAKIDVYKKNNPELLKIDPYLGVYFYRINVTKPPLNDKRIRRALCMALDREAIVKYVTRGGQLPANSLVPPDTAGYNGTARVPGDIAAAKKLLADAGFPGGRGLPPVEILYNTQEAHRTIAEAIQQMWKKELGIQVELMNKEWKVYLDAQRILNYQICRAGWIGDYSDPNTFMDMFVKDGGNNETGWSNPEYDRLIREAGLTGDQKKRYDLFQKAEAILMDECPIIPIYFYTRVHLQRPNLKGWHPTILDNHPYKFVWLE